MGSVGYVAGGIALGSLLSNSGGGGATSTSDPSAGYSWQNYWREQDIEFYKYEAKQKNADQHQQYYNDLLDYRNQFILRYGNTRPQELKNIDSMINTAYIEYNNANKEATTSHWMNSLTKDMPNRWTTQQPSTLIQPTGGGILGDYAAINDKISGIESDFAKALAEHAQVRDANDAAFATKLTQSLSSMTSGLRSSNAQFKSSMNSALSSLTADITRATAGQRAALSTLRSQLAGSNTRATGALGTLRTGLGESESQARKAIADLKRNLNLSEAEARSAVATLQAGIDESSGLYKRSLAELKLELSENQAKYVEALTQSKDLYSAAVGEARDAISKQEEFYTSLIEDPGLASGQVRNLLTAAERDLKGQIQNIEDYYARIGRSGGGEERKAIADLRSTLARSFAENVAFTSDYGRQQSTALALEKAGLSKEEAQFSAQIAEAIQAGDTERLKTIFAASATTAQGLSQNAQAMSVGKMTLAQLMGASAQTKYGAEMTLADLLQQNAQTLFGGEMTVADLLRANAQTLFSGESYTNEFLSNAASTLFSGRTSTANAVRASDMETAQNIFGAETGVAGQILGAQTATAESNLSGAEFSSQLSAQFAQQLQALAGEKLRLGASLTLPTIGGNTPTFNPASYGSVEPYRVTNQDEGVDLQGLGSLLALLAQNS